MSSMLLTTTPDPLIALVVGLAVLGTLVLLVWPHGGILGYRRRLRQFSARVLREDALKMIGTAELGGEQANLQSVAGVLEVSANQAAEVLADLEKRGLVVFERSEVHLTPSGREYALHIIRTHRLFERYLAEKTGLRSTEWHKEAHRLEHLASPSEVLDLSERLGNPSHDPHGDPIPTAAGEFARAEGKPLTEAPLDRALRIVHIEDEPEMVFKQLMAEELSPGMVLRVLEKTPQRIRFSADGEEHVLAPSLAVNVSVTAIDDADLKDEEQHMEELSGASRLSSLRRGQKARVLGVSRACRGNERRRLMDLGFVPGTIVEVEMVSPSGEPTAYRLRGTLIALRSEQAAMIRAAALEEVKT